MAFELTDAIADVEAKLMKILEQPSLLDAGQRALLVQAYEKCCAVTNELLGDDDDFVDADLPWLEIDGQGSD